LTPEEEVKNQTISATEVLAELAIEDFVFLPGCVPEDVVEAAKAAANEIETTPDESVDEGIHLWHYPFGYPELDNFLDESGLLSAAEHLLGTKEVLLNNCMLWLRTDDSARRVRTSFHRDYADNCLVARSGVSDAVGIIIYFTPVTQLDGPTVYLPRSIAGRIPVYPRYCDLPDNEQAVLDASARFLVGPAGSVLIHSLLGVHRASLPLTNSRRISMHAVLRRADAHWVGWTAWPRLCDSERFRSGFSHLTPGMKALLGWPKPEWLGWKDDLAQQIANARFPSTSGRNYRDNG
jgi:hypothetical protein